MNLFSRRHSTGSLVASSLLARGSQLLIFAACALLLLLGPCSYAPAQCPGGMCRPPAHWGTPNDPLLQPPSYWKSGPGANPTYGQRVSTATYANWACRITNGSHLGSGTVIGGGGESRLVLTCHHLFRDGVGSVSCHFTDGETIAATVVGSDEAHDLVLLELRTIRSTSARVASTQPSGTYTNVGFGMTGQLRAIRGRIFGEARRSGAEFNSLRIGATVMSGDSGGGVYDEESRLCGVIWGVRNSVAYVTPLRPIRRLLDRLRARRSPPDQDLSSPPATWPADNGSPVQPGLACDCDDRFAAVEKRLDDLAETNENQLKLNEQLVAEFRSGQYATSDQLASATRESESRHAALLERIKGLAGDATAKAVAAAKQRVGEAVDAAEKKTASRIHDTTQELFSHVDDKLSGRIGIAEGLSWTKLLTGTLGLSTPIAVGLVLAGKLGKRRIRRRRQSRGSEVRDEDRFHE